MAKIKSLIIFAFLILPIFTIFASLANSASARQLTKEERKFYAQNNIIFTVPCDSESDCKPEESAEEPDNPENPDTPSEDPGTHTVSGPEGINISKEVIKPCPSSVSRSTHSGATYSYSYSGANYTVVNTTLDLDSYISYLKSRHIKQDGQTCDPLTGNCYHNNSKICSDDDYCDYGYCLQFATVFAGNLHTGNCTSTDYGAGHYAGATSQAGPTMNQNAAPIRQAMYDAVVSGKIVVAKVASGSSRHFVVAVGVKTSANRTTVTDSDFLYLDPSRYLTTTRTLYSQPTKGGYWIKIVGG